MDEVDTKRLLKDIEDGRLMVCKTLDVRAVANRILQIDKCEGFPEHEGCPYCAAKALLK